MLPSLFGLLICVSSHSFSNSGMGICQTAAAEHREDGQEVSLQTKSL